MLHKKIAALILCAAILTPTAAEALSAETNGSAAPMTSCASSQGSDVTAPGDISRGEQFTVYLTVSGCPSVSGLVVDINYRTAFMNLKEVNTELDNGFYSRNTGTVHYAVLYRDSGVNMSNETTVAAFTFKATRKITASSKLFSFNVKEFYDKDMKELDYGKVNFKFTANALSLEQHKHTVVIDKARPADCAQTGLTEGSHCSVCGDVITPQTVIPKTQHNYQNGVCTICGAADPNNMKGIYGDIDNDGKITSADSLLILRRSVSIIEFNSVQEKLADVDSDGTISSADSLEVLRCSVQLPCKEIIGTVLK